MITIEHRRIIDAMKSGARLCVQIGDSDRSYFFSDNSVSKPQSRHVQQLLAMGVIAEAGDGLFGDSQTFDLVFDPK